MQRESKSETSSSPPQGAQYGLIKEIYAIFLNLAISGSLGCNKDPSSVPKQLPKIDPVSFKTLVPLNSPLLQMRRGIALIMPPGRAGSYMYAVPSRDFTKPSLESGAGDKRERVPERGDRFRMHSEQFLVQVAGALLYV